MNEPVQMSSISLDKHVNNGSASIGDGYRHPIDRDHITSSSEEWKEKGAATLVKSERGENGQIMTRVIKKGVKDFNFGRTLGEGSYSTVVMATDRQTLRDYAIKILDKRHIIKEKKVKYVNIEKNTLNRLGDHPGIIRLYYTFQDEKSLYFVLDYAPNGELLTLIKNLGSLDENCTRYYGAQLLDAIEFMHSKGVIHRDLKPENILLDDKMRIRITDFGTAKLMNGDTMEDGNVEYPEDVRANSFVGTAEYVSPELLSSKHAGKGSDVWAFGCILYQLLAGRPPFKASNEYQTFQKIVKLQYSYPPGFPFQVRDLCKKVLVLDPNDRLTIDQIKQHEFFKDVEWDRKSIWKKPPPRIQPYKPSSRSISKAPQYPMVPGIGSASLAALNASKNVVSASTAAAAALSKTPQQISNYPPVSPGGLSARRSLPHLSQFAATHHQQQQQTTVEPTISPTTPTALTPTGSKLDARPNTERSHSSLKKLSNSVNNQVSTLSHSLSSTALVEAAAAPPPQPSAPPPPPPAKLEIPPATRLDAEWAGVLLNYEERVLRVGNVTVVSTNNGNSNLANNDEDSEPSRITKFFSTGLRKKKRTLLVTSGGRLLLIGDDRKIRHEIPLTVPQVTIRELPLNRKNNAGCLSVETHNKVFTIEDAFSASSEWIAVIKKSREYHAQSSARETSDKFATAATAASLAVRGASVGSLNNATRPYQPSAMQYIDDQVSWNPQLVTSSNSAFLQKNEDRKKKR